MCGRYTFEPSEEFSQRFHAGNRLDSFAPRYNIAPGQLGPLPRRNKILF
jgi:hypothetical protein